MQLLPPLFPRKSWAQHNKEWWHTEHHAEVSEEVDEKYA